MYNKRDYPYKVTCGKFPCGHSKAEIEQFIKEILYKEAICDEMYKIEVSNNKLGAYIHLKNQEDYKSLITKHRYEDFQARKVHFYYNIKSTNKIWLGLTFIPKIYSIEDIHENLVNQGFKISYIEKLVPSTEDSTKFNYADIIFTHKNDAEKCLEKLKEIDGHRVEVFIKERKIQPSTVTPNKLTVS